MALPFTVSLRLNARRRPRHIALRTDAQALTYLQLWSCVSRMMHALAAHGVGPGARVAMLPTNTPDTLITLFALTGVGAIPVPISSQLSDSDIGYILGAAEVSAIIVQADRQARLSALMATPALYAIKARLCLGASPPAPGWVALDPAIASASEDDAYLGHAHQRILSHTSGTTGRPKLPLRGAWAFEERAIEQGFNDADQFLAALTFSAGLGLTYALLPLYLGATVHLLREWDAEQAMALIDARGITATLMLPAMLRQMMKAPGFSTFSGRSLRLIQSGAGVVEADIRQCLHAKLGPVLSIYAASTEVGPIANLKGDDVVRLAHGNCVGRPFFGVEVKLLDNSQREVPAGEVGEICARSATQFEHYHGEPELSASTRRGAYMSVGDLGRFDADGYLYFVGRKADVLRVGNRDVYTNLVEEALMACPGIAEVACVDVQGPDGALELWAAIVLHAEGSLDGVAAHGAQHLPPHSRPRRYVRVNALPRTATSRVIRAKLREQLTALPRATLDAPDGIVASPRRQNVDPPATTPLRGQDRST